MNGIKKLENIAPVESSSVVIMGRRDKSHLLNRKNWMGSEKQFAKHKCKGGVM